MQACRALVIVMLLGAVAAGPMVSGGTAQSVPEAEVYQAALERYEAAVEERAHFQEEYHDPALERVSEARAAGEEDELQAALAPFYSRALELGELDRRVARAAEELEAARSSYLNALDREEDAVHEALAATDDPDEERRLHRRLADLRAEYREAEGEVEIERNLPPVPDLSVDPRDGPTELVHKARMLESRAQEYEAVIREIDGRIEALEERLRRDRALQDNMADLSRFDDVDVPVAPPTSGDSDDIARGVAPVGRLDPSLGDLSPAEVIAMLEEIRNRAESLRVEAVAQAEEFRDRVESSET